MSAAETGKMSAAETGKMSAAETGQMSAVETRQLLKSPILHLALNRQKCPEMDPELPQDLGIGPPESSGHFLPSGTIPAAQIQ